ncbi:DNA-binding response regulator [Pseudomonas abyssi]|jgi:DNA-binding NarL/FixJ family response regulator|uniref:DNA-binding response regulator n=1 Tax=Pseudomonas abyssi TaxID=170540 RepID=A0A2A3MND4_9PSED|nr:response regulator transcription factor [Pseudomonas abyssi]MAC99581.1 DNA-binding response regulator [Pseudomonadales bacterium]PBK06311.1 DNA-binding response regulator [Pseudomonas abyssi]|tara:strand:- start:160755 stop:161402 length:648 start_codon:yes stop_codon:yes gene_type:complete
MQTTNRVLIIEDMPQVADWLTQRLHEALGQCPVDLACSSAQANELIKHNRYQLALVDLGLPDGNGVDLLPLLKNQSPQTQCIVTTIFDDAEHLFAALRAGADGYLLKDEDEQAFVAQLGGIVQGKPPLSASIARRILEQFRPAPASPSDALTPREQQLLQLIARGLSVKGAAQELGISPHTAASYLKVVYQKLQINCRAEAAIKAMDMGLLNGRQ